MKRVSLIVLTLILVVSFLATGCGDSITGDSDLEFSVSISGQTLIFKVPARDANSATIFVGYARFERSRWEYWPAYTLYTSFSGDDYAIASSVPPSGCVSDPVEDPGTCSWRVWALVDGEYVIARGPYAKSGLSDGPFEPYVNSENVAWEGVVTADWRVITAYEAGTSPRY